MIWVARAAVALLAVLALLIVALHGASRVDGVQRWLGRQVAERLGAGVAVGRVAVSTWPPLGVRALDATIEDPRSGRAVLSIAELTLALDIAGLPARPRVAVDAVAIDDAVLVVDLREDGGAGALDAIAELFAGRQGRPRDDAPRRRRAVDLPVAATDVTVVIQPADAAEPPVELVFPRLDVAVSRAAGDATLAIAVDADVAGGSLAVSIRSTDRQESRDVEIDLRAGELALREIFAAPPADFQRASIEMSLQRPAGATATTGTGQVRLRDGVISSASLGAALWRAVFELLPGGGGGAADLVRSQPTRLEHLTTRFALRQRRVELRDLELRADDYQITGDGSVGFDARLALDLRVFLTPAGLTKMLLVADLPAAPLPVAKLPPIPIEVSGTIDDPVVTAQGTTLPLALLGGTAEVAEELTGGILDRAREVLDGGTKRALELFDGD